MVVSERIAITAGYFTTLGVQMRAGRPFSDLDSAESRTVIANDALARRLFENRDPIGERIWIDRTPYEIVGVVANYNTNVLASVPEPKIFLPIARDGSLRRVNFLVRAEGDPAALVQAARREVRKAAAGTDAASAYPVDRMIDIMGQEMLLGTSPLFPLVAIGMLLTTAGIYGVLAFALTRRTRELAIRVAVGASGWDLVRLVAAHTLRLVAVGCAIGIALTYALARVVRAGGGAGSIFDPALHAFILPVLVVLAIGLAATVMPSRRALKIEPVVLLRTS
jgi:ABC-type antimicrobial peptide transport system permease subunit